MTGRDLILYILTNGLEDEPIFKDDKFIGFLSVEDVAVKMGVGPETVKTLIVLGSIEAIQIGDALFIPAYPYFKPREEQK